MAFTQAEETPRHCPSVKIPMQVPVKDGGGRHGGAGGGGGDLNGGTINGGVPVGCGDSEAEHAWSSRT